MILSDADILHYRSLGQFDIHPWVDDLLQPASYDLRLAPKVATPAFHIGGEVAWIAGDFEERGLTYILEPDEFALFSTIETITLSNQIAAQVAGKSTWARRGLIVESAGWVDPGFCGTLTLELKNLTSAPIVLTAGDPIAQIVFMELRTKSLRGYSVRGRYQNQDGPTPARDSA